MEREEGNTQANCVDNNNSEDNDTGVEETIKASTDTSERKTQEESKKGNTCEAVCVGSEDATTGATPAILK